MRNAGQAQRNRVTRAGPPAVTRSGLCDTRSPPPPGGHADGCRLVATWRTGCTGETFDDYRSGALRGFRVGRSAETRHHTSRRQSVRKDFGMSPRFCIWGGPEHDVEGFRRPSGVCCAQLESGFMRSTWGRQHGPHDGNDLGPKRTCQKIDISNVPAHLLAPYARHEQEVKSEPGEWTRTPQVL